MLVSRDDEHNPVKTVAAYRELVERENVVAMLGATNSASMRRWRRSSTTRSRFQ